MKSIIGILLCAFRLVIDAHTHILPKKWPDLNVRYGYDGFLTLNYPSDLNHPIEMFQNGRMFRKVQRNCFDSPQRTMDMDHLAINIQVLCTVPVMFHYWAKPKHTHEISIALNDDLAQTIAAHPNRFVGLGTVPMNDTSLAVQELERCIEQLGFHGVQIGSHVNDQSLADQSLFPFFERAQELDAAILIHPWDMVGRELMSKYWLPWLVGMPSECSFAACSLIFGGVMARLPNLKVCLSHGGGSFPWTIGRIEHGYKVRPDLVAIDNPNESPRAYLKRFYYDAHTCDPYTLSELMRLVGPDRIMLGSDYPFPLGEYPPGSLIDSLEDELDEMTKDRLFHGTAIEWLSLRGT